MRAWAAFVLWAAATTAAAEPAALAVRASASFDWTAVAAQSVRPLRPVAGATAGIRTARVAAATHAIDRWHILEFASPRERDAAAVELAARGIESEPVRSFALQATGAVVVPPNITQVRAPEARARITPDGSIVVGVVDSGSDLTHPDLVARLWQNEDPPGNADPADDAVDQNGDGEVEDWERDDDDDNGYVDDQHGYDFVDAPGADAVGDALQRDPDPNDEDGHGTHVAGILCADGNLQGVAPFVQLMTLRAAYSTPFGGGVLETDDAAAAIVYAADNGARVLNLSWGDTVESRLIRSAIEYALARDVIVVAAAGNRGSTAPHWPSHQPGVVSVGAVNAAGQRAGFSNHGAGVTLAAPGEIHSGFDGGILSLAPGGRLARLRGTSMAAPHVAGAAAILLSRPEHPNAEAVRAWLVGSARGGDAPWDEDLAHGVLDCLGAVESRQDLIVQVHGPPRAFRTGRVTLVGTVLGADLVRWRVEARPPEAGAAISLRDWTDRRADADTLVDTAFSPATEGEWSYAVVAETGDGASHAHVGRLRIDTRPPVADSLGAVAAYRGADPRWLLTAASDEEIAFEVTFAAGDTLRAADAGLVPEMQIETPPRPGAGARWTATLTDAVGLQTAVELDAAAVLDAWPATSGFEEGDTTTAFAPDPVAALGPEGAWVVWGRGSGAGQPSTLQAWGLNAGRWARQRDTGATLRPVAAADVNGDGAADVLGVRPTGGLPRVVFLVTRSAATWPDTMALSIPAERALGLFQLDGDAPFEALVSSRDSIFLHDDLATGGGARLQTLVDPATTGFRVFGADAAAGDFDGDGRIEIAAGDAEGDIVVWERTPSGIFELATVVDTGGTYAYDIEALPSGGFIAASQRTSDVGGDGFSIAVHDFTTYTAAAGAFVATRTHPVLTPTNALAAGIAVARDSGGAVWSAFVRGADLYLGHDSGAGFEPRAYTARGGGDAPLLADLDADGGLDIVWRHAGVTHWARIATGALAARDLRGESLGSDRIRLDWIPAAFGGGTSRIRRSQGGDFVDLAVTTAASWIDSTLAPFEPATYEIESLDQGEVRGRSNRVVLQARPLLRILALETAGSAALRVRCSNPLGPSALRPDLWTITSAVAPAPRVLQVALADGDRAATLLLDRALSCGAVRVTAGDIRDTSHGRWQVGFDTAEITIPCALPTFAVETVRGTEHRIEIVFDRAVAPETVIQAAFEVRWNDAVQAITSATLDDDSTTVRLEFASPLHGRGEPIRVRVTGDVRALDGTMLSRPDAEYWVRLEGAGASAVFAYPNPVRAGDDEVVFAEASAATRVRIYDLEGQLVADLSSAQGGGLRWNLRGRGGQRVASGAYLYVAEDASGRQQGRIVLAR